MSVKDGSRELVWLAFGVLGLLGIFVAVLYSRSDRDVTAQFALTAQRVELVNAMRLAIAAASEAQNSAVMSTAEQDSQVFADQARTATAALDKTWTEFLALPSDEHELELRERVTETLREFQQIDKKLLEVAVQNSNQHAYKLAFGPARKSLQEMDEALAHIADNQVKSTSENKIQMLQSAGDARIGVLRIQVLLMPHIAEESDQRMDELEAQITKEEERVREKLAVLQTLLPPSDAAHLGTAASRYAEFQELRARIIKLSRENTDVRSVALALNEKRKAMLACEDALAALERAIRAEPIKSTIPSGR